MLSRALAKPLVRVVLILAVMLMPWPGLGPSFAAYFGAVLSGLVALFSKSTLLLELSPAAPSGPEWSLLFDAHDTATQQGLRAVLDVRRSAFVPLAVFVALVIGVPSKRPRRRLVVLGAGATLLHCLALLPFLAFFGSSEPRVFELAGPLQAAAVIGYRALIAPPGMAYAVPALLWFALCWRFEPELM